MTEDGAYVERAKGLEITRFPNQLNPHARAGYGARCPALVASVSAAPNIRRRGASRMKKRHSRPWPWPLLCTAPAFAALKVGDTAPHFTAQGSLGGKDFTFHLKGRAEEGPGRWSISIHPPTPAAAILEAHTFAEQSDKFAAAGASIIGVSADDLHPAEALQCRSSFCAGKFPSPRMPIPRSLSLTT